MFDLTKSVSEFLYDWILNIDETGDGDRNLYHEIFANDGEYCGHGMEYCLFFLLGISILAALCFYFVISRDITKATKKNYIITCVVGYICLVVTNYFGLDYLTDVDGEVFYSFNVFKVCLIDILYYAILLECWSLLMKSRSNAGNIDLLKVF